MANTSGAIRAGGAFVEVFAESNPLVRGLRKSEDAVHDFARKAAKRFAPLQRAIGSTTKAVGKLTKGMAKMGKIGAVAGGAAGLLGTMTAIGKIGELDQLNKTAAAFGLMAENASGLFGVFQMSGADNMRENIESLVTLAQRVKQAASGEGGQGGQLFEGLNVSAQELSKLDPSEQFFRLHEAIMQLEDPAERINKLMLAFGEDGGKTLIATLSKSTEELRAQAGQFKVNQEQLDRASETQKSLNELTASYQRIWGEIAVAVAPTIKRIADIMAENLRQPAIAIATTKLAIIEGLANIEKHTISLQTRLADSMLGVASIIEGTFATVHDTAVAGIENLLAVLRKLGPLAGPAGVASMAVGDVQLDRFERTNFDDARQGNANAGFRRIMEVEADVWKARREFMEAVKDAEAVIPDDPHRLPVEAPRPGAPDAPVPPPVEQEIVERAASAGINNASIVGTSGAAQAIAKAMAQGKAAEWEKKNNSVLKDIKKNTDKPPVEVKTI